MDCILVVSSQSPFFPEDGPSGGPASDWLPVLIRRYEGSSPGELEEGVLASRH